MQRKGKGLEMHDGCGYFYTHIYIYPYGTIGEFRTKQEAGLELKTKKVTINMNKNYNKLYTGLKKSGLQVLCVLYLRSRGLWFCTSNLKKKGLHHYYSY